MAQSDTKNTVGLGNTKTNPQEKEEKRERQYCFTVNNYNDTDINTLLTWFKANKKTIYCFQEEIGEETGTPHLQGFVSFTNPVAWSTWKNKINKAHFKKKFAKKWQDSFKYCCKDETRIAGGRIWTSSLALVRSHAALDNFFKLDMATQWQLDLLEIIKTDPDHRLVRWIWENIGGVGKSLLARYIIMKYPDEAIMVSGKGADIKFAIKSWIDGKHGILPRIILIDCPRSNLQYLNYTVIEEVKNAVFCSSKYESGMVLMNYCHIIIFANEAPDKAALSDDRWVIWKLLEDGKQKISGNLDPYFEGLCKTSKWDHVIV